MLLLTAAALSQSEAGYKPEAGFVPDAKTASAISEAVLIPVYGKKQVESEKPFSAKLKNGVWTVAGTLNCRDQTGALTTECDGGVAVVEISKSDARILSMIHGK